MVLAFEHNGDIVIWPFPYLVHDSGYSDWAVSVGVRLNQKEFHVLSYCAEAEKILDGRIENGETTIEEIVRKDLSREVLSIGPRSRALACVKRLLHRNPRPSVPASKLSAIAALQ